MRRQSSIEIAKIMIVSSRHPKCENNVFDANTTRRTMNYIDGMKSKHNVPIGVWLVVMENVSQSQMLRISDM